MYLPIESGTQTPHFKECAKHPAIEETGFIFYYTDQCPYTYYWVPRVQEVAQEHGIPFKTIHITDKESAQHVPAPVSSQIKNSWRWQGQSLSPRESLNDKKEDDIW